MPVIEVEQLHKRYRDQVAVDDKPPPEVLGQREPEVLALIADGATNRQTVAKLFVSEATVKAHLLHIYEELGVRDRAAAVAEAYRRRLLT